MPYTPTRRPLRQAKPQNSRSDTIFSENAAKVISRVVFAIGLFSLFSYFFHIEYFPTFDLKSAASYGSALAYVLMFIITTLSLAFLIPYLMAATFIRAKPNKRGNNKLIVEIVEWVFYGMLSMCAISACIFTCLHLEWPIERGLLLVLLAMVLISSVRVCFIRTRRKWKIKQRPVTQGRVRLLSIRGSNTAYGLFWTRARTAPANASSQLVPSRPASRTRFFTRHFGPLLLLAYRRSLPTRAQRLWERRAIRRILWTQWLGTMLTGVAQLFPLTILLLTLERASEIETNDLLRNIQIAAGYAMYVALAGGALLYLALSPAHRKNWHLGLSVVFCLPLLLSMLSQSSGMLPMTVMHITKNGNFRAEKIVLSSKTCDSLAPILGIDCNAKSTKPILLCNVHIMSRVGQESYLRLPEKRMNEEGKHRVQRLFVPTMDILAMDVNFDLKFLRLKELDDKLATLSPECMPELTTLRGDSAFSFNDFTLTDEGKAQLLQFVYSIRAWSDRIKEVAITGHADQVGTKAHNDWLSMRRANEVSLFIERELKKTQIAIPLSVSAKGSAQPVIKDCSRAKHRAACEAPNRRVEVLIIEREVEGKST